MALLIWKICCPCQRFGLIVALHVLLNALATQVGGQPAPDSSRVKLRWKSEGHISAHDLYRIDRLGKSRLLRAAEMEVTVRRALEALQQRGFYFAQIDSVIFSSPLPAAAPEATVFLRPNARVELTAKVRGVDSSWATFGEKRNNAFDMKWQRELGGKFAEADLQQRLVERLVDLARRGYPLARFRLDSVIVAQKENEVIATLELRFDPGPAVRIDSIVIRGNKLTKRHVLIRELPVRAGDRFHLEKVQSIPDRLMRLGYLHSVAPPQLAIDARGRYLLDISVTEGNSNFFNGIAGYNPAVGNQKGYLTGLIDLKFGNLLGTGRQFNARWEKRGIETQELALRYREPWVASYPVHLSGGFKQLIQDTLYVERKWDLAAEVPVGQNFVVSGHLSQERVSPDSLGSVRFGVPASRVRNVGLGLRYDSTDDPINPRRGVFYLTAGETGRKTVQPLDSRQAQTFSRERIFIDFHWLQPTFWSQVLSLAIHGRLVSS
ncbi:MAG: BamA/TamA family outer membrane protein, partial [candidate division KSB1 bacterium]|nr:BamA/TamA family outer membrane protein [candidate division KSB1 bacterium]